jgi:CRP-like cAMP-binding protein
MDEFRASVAERRDRAPACSGRKAVPHQQNRILASLPQRTQDALKPYLKLVELKHGSVLFESGATVDDVYFPHSGVISLVVELAEGEMLETAMVGRDGVLGVSSALDGKVSLNKAIIQSPGMASIGDADRVRDVALKDDAFRSRLIRHEQVLFAAVQQSAACNASHTVEARLCRWLLRLRDLVGDDLQLTQEFLAQMIGARRSSVSLVAATLQAAGLIRYSRGNIRLLNVEGLKEASCECYDAVRGHYERMLDGR